MSYSVTTQYDSRMPSWPGNGTPFTLIACHDTEGGQGRSGALGTIQFMIQTAAQRAASYHELWWYHEATDEFGVIRIVPPYRAAGSVAPQRDKYTPTQWVKDSLGVNAWDPNQGIYAVSIAGTVADVNRYSQNTKFLLQAHRRMMELWKELGITKRAEHFQFNPATRSDWGKLLMPALGGLVTKDTWTPPAETSTMNPIMFTPPAKVVLRAGTSIRLLPDLSAASKPWTIASPATVTVIAKVEGEDFGAGSNWLAYVISPTGGLRFVHSQDVISTRVLLDPASVDSDPTDEIAAATEALNQQIETLNAKAETQATKIADLMTEVAEAEKAAADALTRAENAEDAASSAVALRTALTDFLN